MIKKTVLALVLVMALAGSSWPYTGTGSSSDPYIINTYSDFRTLMQGAAATASDGKYFKLSCDIQLSGYTNWEPAGTLDNPFTGHFDGQGHIIYINIQPLPVVLGEYIKLTYDRSLFGVVDSDGDAIVSLDVEGVVRGYNAGGLVSILQGGRIKNCSFSGDVIVETSPEGTEAMNYLLDELGDDDIQDANGVEILDDVLTKSRVYGKINAGGIAAVMLGGSIEDSSFRGNVIASADETPASAGGIVGKMIEDSARISGCLVEGDAVITASTSANGYGVLAMAGGIAGYANTQLNNTIESCTFDGIVNSTYYAGGIAGEVHGTILSGDTVTSTSRITGTYSAGGIAGYMASGAWAKNNTVESGSAVTAETYSAGGIIGLLETSGRAVENNTSYAAIRGNASWQGGIVGALGNNTYSGISIGSGNSYSGADYGIGRDEWGKSTDGVSAGGTALITKSSDVTYSISTTTLANAVVGTYYTASLDTTAPSSKTVTWTYSGTLPAGLTGSSNGSITGTPTAAGTYTFKAGANISSYGHTASADITITVTSNDDSGSDSGFTISTSSLNTGRQYTYYNAYISATGYTAYDSITWELAGGSLPSGLDFTTSGIRGRIYGTPEVSGTFSFTVQAALTYGTATYYATKTFTLSISVWGVTISTDKLPDATLRRYYSADIEADYSAAWTLTDGSLPEGLSLSTVNGKGRISGTPSESGEFTFTLTAASGGLTGEKEFTLVVNDADFSITTGSLMKPGIAGTYYTETLSHDAKTSNASPVWYLYSGSLPEGLNISRTAGTISGTPAAEGTYTFRIGLLIGDQITSKSFTVTIIPDTPSSSFSITTLSLDVGAEGTSYSQTLSTDAPVSIGSRVWYIYSGDLPAGLSLSGSTGTISGTPSESGSYTFTVGLLAGGQTAFKTFTLVIFSGSEGISITTSSLPPAVQGVENSYTLSTDALSSADSLIWYIDSGDLPSGLTLSRNDGTISGTPSESGNFTFRVRLLAGDMITAKTFTLTVAAGILIADDSLPDGKEGTPYSYTLTVSGDASVVWRVSDGTLPPGLSLDRNGRISGTPSKYGEYPFTVQAEAGERAGTKRFTLTINSAFSILTDAALPRAKAGTWYSLTLSADAEAANLVSWKLLDGTLPFGLYLNSETGNISGTPEAEGTYTFTIQASAGGYLTVKRFTLIVGSVLEILTETPLQPGKVGVYYSCMFTTYSAYPVSWTLSGGSVPSGLTFSDGMLSGTPTYSGTYTFTLSAESGGLTSSKTFTLEISPALSIITPAILPSVKAGAYYSYVLESDAEYGSEVFWALVRTGINSGDEYSYTYYGRLPSGMYIDENTGTVYGTPRFEGVYTFTVRAVMGSISTTKDFTLTVRPTLSITTGNILPHAETNEKYSVMLLADAEEDQAVTWSVVDGVLPERLLLDAQTGELSGYILNEGTYSFTIQAFSNGLTAQKRFELTAGEIMSIITPQVSSVLEAGEYFELALLTDNTNAANTTWAVIDGILPPGIDLNTTTGVISGTPSRAGTYTFTIYAVSGYSVAQKQFTLKIGFVISDSTYLENGKAGQPYTHKFTAKGVSAGAVLWTVSSDEVLPRGLTLETNGILSGITNQAGTYTFMLYAFVSNDVSAKQTVRLTIDPLPNSAVPILTTSLPDGQVSRDYYAELRSSVDGVIWSVSGDLPLGLALVLSKDVGVISGKPKIAGVSSFDVTAEKSASKSTRHFTITINAVPETRYASGGGGGCDSGIGMIGLAVLGLMFRRHRR